MRVSQRYFLLGAAVLLRMAAPAHADDGWAKAFSFPLISNSTDAGRGVLFQDPNDGKDYAYFGAATAVGVQVWRSSDGVSWNQVNVNGFGTIGGQAIASGIAWIAAYSTGAASNLYVGASANPQIPGDAAQVYRSGGGTSVNQWTLVFSSVTTGNSNNTTPGGGHRAVFNGAMYIGTKNNTTGAEIWKSTSVDSQHSWILVASTGFGEGPAINPNIAYMRVFGTSLYAATNCPQNGPACGQLWQSTGTTNPTDIDNWTQVLVATNTFDSDTHSLSVLEDFNGFLYVGTLNTAGHAQLFRSATPAVAASWQQVFTPDSGCGSCFSVTTSTEIHALRDVGGVLYAGVWDAATGLIVYRSTDGADWTRSNTSGGFGVPANQYFGDFVALSTRVYGNTFNAAGGAIWAATTASTQTLPGQPILAAAAQGVSSITWSWGSVLNATSFEVLSSTFGNLSGMLSTTTLSWTETGLLTNTTYTHYVAAINSIGISTSAAVTRSTLAMPPTGTAFTGVFGSSITLSWSANTNPAATNYRVNLWQMGGATVTTTVAATAATLTSLVGQTTYFVDVLAVNGDGIATSPDATLSAITQSILVAVATITAYGPATTLSINTAAGPAFLFIPQNAFTSSVFLTLQSPSSYPSAPSPAANLQPINPNRGIQIIENNSVEPVKLVTLTVPYLSSDNVGSDPTKLVLSRLDTAQNVWVPLESSVNATADQVVALSNHLSTFQIMSAAPSTSISAIKIFPNPFRPALGHQYVTFSNLPANTRLRIYTFLGELVKDLTTDPSGIATWDATNRSGVSVASGVYFVFTQGAGSEHAFKVAVQR